MKSSSVLKTGVGSLLQWIGNGSSKVQLRRNNKQLKAANRELEKRVADLSQHSEQMAILCRLSEMLQTSTKLLDLAKIVSVFSREIFPTVSGALYFMNQKQRVMEMQNSWGEIRAAFPVTFRADDCWSLRHGNSYYREISAESVFCGHVAEPLPGFTLCLPLSSPAGVLGILGFQSGKNNLGMSLSNQIGAVSLAHQVSLGLSNLSLKLTLIQDAIRDPLTGLFNRRYLKEALDHEVERCRRERAGMGLIAFDLDNFKAVNDTLGHALGDAVLRGISAAANKTLRAEDILCRQGGDEFLAILPNIVEKNAHRLAERLRSNIAIFVRNEFPQLQEAVTLSAGFAMYPRDGEGSEQLQKSADQALYRAKAQGRNQVVWAHSMGVSVGASPK